MKRLWLLACGMIFITPFIAAQEFLAAPIPIDMHGTVDEIIEDSDTGVIMEKVTILTKKDDISRERFHRKGLVVRRPNAKATILMCHGFMCNKFDVGFIRSLFGSEYNFLAFDFRGHGEEAEGQVCTFGRDEVHDVFAAASFAKAHPDLNKVPLFVFGFSMGAASAIRAQADHPDLFQGMILDCPFDSVHNVLKRSINTLSVSLFGYQFYIPGRQLLHKYAFHPYVQAAIKPLLKLAANMDPREIETHIVPVNPHEAIKHVSIPCLFICCKKDKMVSVDAIKTVYDGAAGYKKLWLTNGRRHCDSFFYNPEGYSKRINKFVASVLDDSIKEKKQCKIIEDVCPLDCGGAIL